MKFEVLPMLGCSNAPGVRAAVLNARVEEGEPRPSLSDQLVALSRHFSIEPHCKLLLSFGRMLDALLHSGVHRYLDFCALETAFFLAGDASTDSIVRMPCSKADIFQSTHFSVSENRAMMKFLQFGSDWGRFRASGSDNATLSEGATTARTRCPDRRTRATTRPTASTCSLISTSPWTPSWTTAECRPT